VSEPIIRVKGLSHTYLSGKLQQRALNNIHLEIARGSCVAFIGTNGSGKTTLIQHFNGLLRPGEGTVIVDGIDVGGKDVDLRALRQRVGMLFQFPEAQLFERTVFSDVAFGPRRMKLDRHEVRTRVIRALETVGLPHQAYAQRSPFELSGGQRRRVALAGILAMSPRILVLDEPSVGLDGDGRADFYRYLQKSRYEYGATIVLVSHDMAEVATIADWLFVMHQGRLVMQGPPREIFAQEERLHECHLAVPPLNELLTLLRKQGMPIPEEIFTLDEAFTYLAKRLVTEGRQPIV